MKNLKKIYKGPRGVLTFFAQLIRYKIVPVRSRKSSGNFFKEGCILLGDKPFGLFVLVSSSSAASASIVQAPQSFQAILVQKRSLLKNLIGCSKQNILKKWLTFQWKKFFVFCLVLPSMSKLMETFVRVQDIFCHSLHMVKDCFCRT